MKKIILLIAAFAALASCDKGPKVQLTTWDSYRNPVVQEVREDPAVLYSGGKFYMYYNGAGDDDVVPLMESKDLVGWEDLTPAFTALTAPAPLPSCSIHSCSVIAHGDEFLMYYTATASSSVIGVATAPFPTGPWTDVGTVVTTVTSDAVLTGAPSVYQDGSSLGLVVSTGKGIFSLKLTDDGRSLSGDAPVKIAPETLSAPTMYKHGRGGQYGPDRVRPLGQCDRPVCQPCRRIPAGRRFRAPAGRRQEVRRSRQLFGTCRPLRRLFLDCL